MFVVHHDPGVDIFVVLTEYMRREEISSVLFADEMRRVDIERISEIRKHHIERDRGVLQNRSQFLAAGHREGYSPTRGGRVALLALGPGRALWPWITAVALRAGTTTVACVTLRASFAARSTGTCRTIRTKKTCSREEQFLLPEVGRTRPYM